MLVTRWMTKWWLAGGVLGATAILVAWRPATNAGLPEPDAPQETVPTSNVIRVTTLHPTAGGLARRTSLPCSAHWHESAGLFAKVSGYLKVQDVDIGARVSQGQLLVEIEMPELERDVDLMAASRLHARAEVRQMEARKKTSAAECRAAQVACLRAEADLQRWDAERTFREKEYQRFHDLGKSESVQTAIVDEKLFQLQSAEAARRAAETAIQAAKEQLLAAEARVELADVDVTVAQAKAAVADANLAKTEQMAAYSKISSPFDGVVTLRNYHRGEFVRAADQGGDKPLLMVARIDLIRVVVQIPDRDVPFAHPGDAVKIDFDALPGREFTRQISRISSAEDPQTRTMRAEVDLPNPEMRIVDQMYGRMEILLEQASDAMRLPSGCIIGDARDGKGQVFVVREKIARLQAITVAADNGSEVEVLSGIAPSDDIVVRAPAGLTDGTPVISVPTP